MDRNILLVIQFIAITDTKVTMESKICLPICTENNQMLSRECISCVFVINLCDFGIFKRL